MNASEVSALLTSHRYVCVTEAELQEAVAQVLRGAGVAFEREVALSPAGRIDFLVDDVGLELKIDGGTVAVVRQLQRYAASPRVSSIVLATTRVRHAIGLATLGELNGKTVHVARLRGMTL